MLSVSHATVGAYLAVTIPNPVISIPAIIVSHYVLDFIPHWDLGTGISSGKKPRIQAFRQEIIDLIISGLLVIFLFQLNKPLEFTLVGLTPYWGAFLGLLPDFLEAPRNFLQKEPKLLRPFNRFHHSLHHSTPNKLLGLIPQVLIILAIFLLR